ncbi:MAG: hypothetical protein E6G85_24960 [Alphaproteobacteria bacterium]|nr:MAG: hypothetical protein E6G85_24960 [Alphaproteobacteria bacterium]
MRRFFAYLLAIAVVLGGGYAGLYWLSEPQEPAISQRTVGESISKTTDVAENGPNVSVKTEASEGSDKLASSNNATAQAPPEMKEDPQASTKKAEEIPQGGCMPMGITARGQLVFPMQCQELLARNRGSGDFEVSPPTNSNPPAVAPKEDQTAEAAKSEGEGSVNQKPIELAGRETNAKLEDWASGAKSSGKGNAAADVKAGRKIAKRNFQNPKSVGMMDIMSTMFPRLSR